MPVLFTCPKTNRQAPTRVHTDAKSLRLAWKKTLRVQCPHCGEEHKVSVRDAFLVSALRDPLDRTVLDRVPAASLTS